MRVSMAVAGFAVAFSSTASAQAIVRPAVFQRVPGAQAAEPDRGPDWFSAAGMTIQPFGASQLGVAASVLGLDVYGPAHCVRPQGQPETCTSNVILSLKVESNVVDAIENGVTAVREYLVSRKGAPFTLALPAFSWTSKRGTVRQSWLAFQAYASARVIPLSNSTGDLGIQGALTAGGSAELNIEFDGTEMTPDGQVSRYPGTLSFSATPTAIAPIGHDVRILTFGAVPPSSVVFGVDYRISFAFAGPKPISFNLSGTWASKGFEGVENSVGLGLSRALSIR